MTRARIPEHLGADSGVTRARIPEHPGSAGRWLGSEERRRVWGGPMRDDEPQAASREWIATQCEKFEKFFVSATSRV